jgi:hypothetical protein
MKSRRVTCILKQGSHLDLHERIAAVGGRQPDSLGG